MGEPSAQEGIPRQEYPKSQQEETYDGQISGLRSVRRNIPPRPNGCVGCIRGHRLLTKQNSSIAIVVGIIPIIGALRRVLVTAGPPATQ
jgi:hypothetical protein